jgi:NAD(P)-dependent dehydrogenase (short-subunit alcohol dehydrogenase family)
LEKHSTMASPNNGSNKLVPPPEDAVIPQLEEHGITYAELDVAIRVLDAVASLNRNKQKKTNNNKDQTASAANEQYYLERYKHINLRPFRKSLAATLELHKQTMFAGQDEQVHYEQRVALRSLKRQKMAEQDLQRKYVETTSLRRGRVEKLQALQNDAADEEQAKQRMRLRMIPDGAVETTSMSSTQFLPRITANPAAVAASTDTIITDATPAPSSDTSSSTAIILPKLRSCYVCKIRFRDLHAFYDQLCPACAAWNWHKRHQTANLSSRVAVVTGARVKIGFYTCLKLLRANCTVVATSRFPNAAAAVFRRQPDFDEWRDRLQVYGLDLRDVSGIEAFCRFLKIRHATTGIDILINNACQTVRRPAGYYAPLVEQEQTTWTTADDAHKAVLSECRQFERARREILLDHKKMEATRMEGGQQPPLSILGETTTHEGSPYAIIKSGEATLGGVAAPFETTGISHSAAMSQMVILPEDAGVSDSILPPGVTDINGQQLDLRTCNSWLLKMEEVSTPEIMECMYINAIAPFVLNSRLKPLMAIPQDDGMRPDRYIINVSAMEGKFYRYKMPCHPHTNMAKAALNMLTRTSAEDLAKNHRIFMNSVDTGWINDENPLERASKTAEKNAFQTPIDEIDAASRILDPIFVGVNGGRALEKDYGKFLKDYRESEW